MSGFPPDQRFLSALFHNVLDIGLVLALLYLMLLIIGERRTLWMVRGLIVLMLLHLRRYRYEFRGQLCDYQRYKP